LFSLIFLAASCLGLFAALYHVKKRPAIPAGKTGPLQAETGHTCGKQTEKPQEAAQGEISAAVTNADDQTGKIMALLKAGKEKEALALISAMANSDGTGATVVIEEKEGKDPDYTPVDVSNLNSVEAKVEKILEPFKDTNSYRKPNDLVKQLIALGEEAIGPLVKMLDKIKAEESDQWACRSAVLDALAGLLTEKHSELIVKLFKEENAFAELICKYRFPEAKEAVMAKLENWNKFHVTSGESDLVDAAFIYDSDRTAQILMKKLREGCIIGSAVERLASIPGLDITDALRQAAQNNDNSFGKSLLVNPMLSKGMLEGLDLALELLQDSGSSRFDNYTTERVAKDISNYFGVIGNAQEIIKWLAENKDNLRWNPATKRFEL